MEEGRSVFKILRGKCTGIKLLGGLGVDERKILEWVYKEIGINTRNWVDSALSQNIHMSF